MGRRLQERKLLTGLKDIAGTPCLQVRLQAGTPPVAWLRPVATRRELQNESDVASLTEWRNKFVTSFLNEFKATESRTSDWLANIVGPDDSRILFMVDDTDNVTIGYMGIGFIDWETGYGEADSIVRGMAGPRGIMMTALQTLLEWGRCQLGLKTIGVRVRSDNPALAFYSKCGFVEQRRVPLSRRVEPDKLVWYEDPGNANSKTSLVYHTLKG